MRRRERIGALVVLACGAMLISCAPVVDAPGAVDWRSNPALLLRRPNPEAGAMGRKHPRTQA